jgi:putative flippase GtrA
MMDSSDRGGASPRAQNTRLARFAAVGASGVLVNLGVLHLLAGTAGLAEIAASALAIEVSILWNFVWNDAVTFRDLRGRGGPALRLARFHAVCAVGILLQLGTFAALALAARHSLGRPELGALRYPAQLCGVAVGFAWNWAGSLRFAWGAGEVDPAARAEPAGVRGARVPVVLFTAMTALLVLPIWLVHYVPTQDGPLHVENVLALMAWKDSPLLQRWYVANWGTQPNWLTQALLAPLLHVMSPVTAEKVVLTGYTILLPVAFRSVLPRGRRGWWAALAAFPFVHSFPYHMGFWNFCWGLALAFFWVGVWLRHRGRLTLARGAGLAALGVVLYLAHLVAFAGALVAGGSVLAYRGFLAFRRARGSPARRRLVVAAYARRVGGGVLVAAPGIALILAWLLAHSDRTSARIPVVELLAKLATGYAMVSIDRVEIFFAVGVVLVLFIAVVHLVLARACRRGPRLRPQDGWLVAAAVFAVLYVAVPDVVTAGAHVSDRLALFAFLCVGAWLGAGVVPGASLRRATLALAGLAVAATAVRLVKQRELSVYLEEYVTAAQVVSPNAIVLPLALAPHGPRDAHGRRMGYRVKPFLHAASWIVAERGGVDLKNSQANTDQCPVRWPADRNPFRIIATSIGRMEGVPPCVDLRAIPRLGRVDYVLVWGATRENLDTPCGAVLAADLAQRYEPVFLSEPTGMLQVWRPREVTAGR